MFFQGTVITDFASFNNAEVENRVIASYILFFILVFSFFIRRNVRRLLKKDFGF